MSVQVQHGVGAPLNRTATDRLERVKAQSGDAPKTLEALLITEYGRIHGLARRFGIPESDSQDAAQEVCAKAWAHRDGFKGGSAFATWLTRIAVNHYSTWLKKHRRTLDKKKVLQTGPKPEASNPRTRAEHREAFKLASACVRRLPRGQRAAFVLRYLEGLSSGEASEVLGITEGALRARAYEARKNLRDMLKEYEL